MKKKLLALFLALSMAVSLVSPAVATGTANEGGDPAPAPEESVVVGCGECGQAEGHADTCSQYVAPQPQPEQKPELPKPEQPPVKEEPAVCDCGTETDFHAKDCAAPEEAHEPAVVCTEDEGKFVAVKHHDDKHMMDLEKEYADTTLYVVAEDFYQDLFFKCEVTCFEMKVEAPAADGQLAEVTGEDLTFAMMTAEGHDAVVSLSPAVEPGTVITLTACELSEEEAAQAIADGEEVATYTVTIQVVEQDALECQFCGVSLVVEKKHDKVTHKDDCQTNCTCQPVEGEHVEGCPLYVPPVEIPEEQPPLESPACQTCGKTPCECVTCETCGKVECECVPILCDQCEATQAEDGTVIHEKTCPQYKLQKGDALWLKNGSLIYKDYTNADEQPYELRFSHGVTFEQEIIAEDGTVWYEFKLNSIDDLFILGYKYVKAESTSVTEPVEIVDKVEEINGTTVTIPSVPADAVLEVKMAEIPDIDSTAAENLFCFDISLTNGDGTPWTGGDVTVTLELPAKVELDENQGIKIAHVKDDGSIEYLEGVLSEDGMSISFTTDSFSLFYAFVFEYNGYMFTLADGSSVYLSQLLYALGSDRDVEDVVSVACSNEEIIDITQEDNDWLLTALESSESDEAITLSITFENGDVIDVSVMDPFYFNYLNEDADNCFTGTVTKNEGSSASAPSGNVIINKDPITGAVLGSAEVEGKVDVIIYARPGMAIRFDRYSDFGTIPQLNDQKNSEDGVWRWVWGTDTNMPEVNNPENNAVETEKGFNYVVISSSINRRTESDFTVRLGDRGDENAQYVTCQVKLIVVPDVVTPILLSDALEDAPEDIQKVYSLVNLPVTLYNYDGLAWNQHYDQNDENFFAFAGNSKGISSRPSGIAPGWTTSDQQVNGGGGYALMGILNEKLNASTGLPTMAQGQQVDLFSQNSVPGKQVYPDVNFEFIYNNDTGYYTYNSARNHAQFDGKNVQLYRQNYAPYAHATDAHANGGFYPFMDIYEAMPNPEYAGFSWSDWKDNLENGFALNHAEYARDVVKPSDSASVVDLHFGIQVAASFYLPEDKMLNGQEMTYNFTGDDDLWVFIDDQLVLDIGGGHTYVSGSFNLTNGEVLVEKYSKLSAEDGGYYETGVYGQTATEPTVSSFLENLEGDAMHTIKIFYLERHSGVSNCYMHFNLPLVPAQSVSVAKDLVNQEDQSLSVTPNETYTFALYAAVPADANKDDVVNEAADNFRVLKNAAYKINGTGDVLYTNSITGQFTLEAGQTAVFEGIDRFTEVYAVEIKPDSSTYSYIGALVNNVAVTEEEGQYKSLTQVVQKDISIRFAFTNKMQTQPLTIEKQVTGGTSALLNPNQKFAFTLDFTKDIKETAEGAIIATKAATDDTALTDGGTFRLECDESITIPRVPVGMTFTLGETNPDPVKDSFIDPKFDATEGMNVKGYTSYEFDQSYEWKMVDGSENEIVVTNTRNKLDLTIIKELEEVAPENQSFLFHVKGNDTNNASVDMDVIINFAEGQKRASVTIAGIPSGSYTVTEDTDWSWRYEITSDSQVEQTKVLYENGEFEFKNERKIDQWLSGDCWCENRWNATSVTPAGTPDPKLKNPNVAS